jgi:hypothetical protein
LQSYALHSEILYGSITVTVADGVKLVVGLCIAAVAFFGRVLFALLLEERQLRRAHKTRVNNPGCPTPEEGHKREGLILVRGRMIHRGALNRRLARQLGKPLW